MPQIILEYSPNLIEKNNFQQLFSECHQLIATQLPTAIAGCKSRAVARDCFYVGKGEANNGFVHMAVHVLPGRSDETLKKLGESLLAALTKHFAASLNAINLQITLEIGLLGHYFKADK